MSALNCPSLSMPLRDIYEGMPRPIRDAPFLPGKTRRRELPWLVVVRPGEPGVVQGDQGDRQGVLLTIPTLPCIRTCTPGTLEPPSRHNPQQQRRQASQLCPHRPSFCTHMHTHPHTVSLHDRFCETDQLLCGFLILEAETTCATVTSNEIRYSNTRSLETCRQSVQYLAHPPAYWARGNARGNVT